MRHFSLRKAKSLIGKEVLLTVQVRSSAQGERNQVVLGKVEGWYQGKDGGFGIKVVNYRRSVQALDNPAIDIDWAGRAIRSYSGRSIKALKVLSRRGMLV